MPAVSDEASTAATSQVTVLRDISWATYESLLADYEERSNPRFTYDRGVLEIMSPSSKHEQVNRAFAQLVNAVAEEIEVDAIDFGSTTFRREDLERGFEPDTCFYIGNIERVAGKKKLDLSVDPPPDLVIEIDITHSSIDKLPIYAEVGVPEVWRYDDRRLQILVLSAGEYREQNESSVLPGVTSEAVVKFIKASDTPHRNAWIKSIRAWAHEIK